MVRKIAWTRKALDDLHDVHEFIAKDSILYARIQVERIQDAVSNLADFPLMGREMPEFPHSRYREILVGNYRVLYTYNEKEDQVYVMSVVHGRRLLKKPHD